MALYTLLALALAAAAPAGDAEGCFDVSEPDNSLSFTGKLVDRVFPGPPNYRSVAKGDAPERTLILEMSASICITDGGQMADPKRKFDTIHLYAPNDLAPILAAAKGRVVTVTGSGFPEHTGHHHAPLVLEVKEITVVAEEAQIAG